MLRKNHFTCANLLGFPVLGVPSLIFLDDRSGFQWLLYAKVVHIAYVIWISNQMRLVEATYRGLLSAELIFINLELI